MSLNKVLLIGRLGADPDHKFLQTGDQCANFPLATSKKWKDKNGQQQEKTEWHRIVVFGAMADNCKKFLAKGNQIFVEGEIRTRKWQDKDNIERSMVEIVTANIRFLETNKNNPSHNQASQQPPVSQLKAQDEGMTMIGSLDELPF
jgi:single-strand DNA-binding protein